MKKKVTLQGKIKVLYDAVIIGGGFYGCAIAAYLAKNKDLKKIAIIEQEANIMQRASYSNQARVHNGYHYPRSFTTAYRSRINLPHFITKWPLAIKQDFTKLYALPRNGSKVTAKQFHKFCLEIGATISPASKNLKKLFNQSRVDDVFKVQEYAFDTSILAQYCIAEIEELNIDLHLNESVTSVTNERPSVNIISTTNHQFESKYIFNCSYSGIKHISGFPKIHTGIKQEITEMALIDVPESLKKIGITVMDGAFFSIMPFPSKKLHTLSHVRYTPHTDWQDSLAKNPYEILEKYEKKTRVDRMIRDTARYLPCIEESKYKESLFEVKTILQKNEGDDGRPILFTRHAENPQCFSVLGGKIDNIFDIYTRLDQETITAYNQ